MASLLESILDELICVFQIQDRSNFVVKQQISKGFSGAEVYLVELKKGSLFEGVYFLKIDIDKAEFQKSKKKYCFSKTATIVKAEKIQAYYVILMEIAGQSSIQYVPFYNIEDLPYRRKAVRKIVPDILRQAIKGKACIGEEVDASVLFTSQLGGKLDKEKMLSEFLVKILSDNKIAEYTGIVFDKDICLPNAYAYAVNTSLWNETKLRNTSCYVHGDLHGDNVFYSCTEDDYALIDLALYREDGYLFFDTAYFELSLLLHNLKEITIPSWINLVKCMSENIWDNINCVDKDVFKDISELEDQWIKSSTNIYCNHRDSMLEARAIARVIAGLNYAGKSKVDMEIRKKSFLYACIYMERLLDIKHVKGWTHKTSRWNEIDPTDEEDEIDRFCAEMDSFDNTQRYFLILGDRYNYSEDILKALTRISWSGIISFSQTEKIEKYLRTNNILNVITVDNSLELITPENLWCVYANGIEYSPATIIETYPKWRNNYSTFLDDCARKIDDVIAPDELQFIIDIHSFSENCDKKLQRLFESLDLIENACVNIALLNTDSRREELDTSNYDLLEFNSYKTTLESLANFCLKYLRGFTDDEVLIPSVSGIRKPIPENDFKFIKNYVFLLHNKVIQYEGNISNEEKRSFYFGKDILWQAIDEKLYIERDEYQEFEEKVRDQFKEKSQFLLRLTHSPGAGATVLLKILAWKLRNIYPVVIVSRINKNIIECLQRLYSLSGKHILLILDGDFSENDITQLLQQSRYYGVKVAIISSNRCYDNSKKDLSTLSFESAINFSEEYKKEMKELKNYSPEEISIRSKNMDQLATNRSMIHYRLPFFFGINAFEDEYSSIPDYLNGIMEHIQNNTEIKLVINYIALITYYTESEGLSVSYAKKLLGLNNKTSQRHILKILNGESNNFVYYSNGVLKICHSIVALKILERQYKIASIEFLDFLKGFINDICKCEGKKQTDRLNDLLMNLFVKRDIEGDISNNLTKKNFSPIILALKDQYLQENFFLCLSQEIPDNAHFHQHYGRLIICNNPDRLTEAKEQFDEAIRLDSLNPLHYHARGQMYTKYIINLCRNKFINSTAQELFNRISQFVEEAISDYEISAGLIEKNPDALVDLSYPYASIVQTTTYVVHQIYLKNTISEKSEKDFLVLNNEVSRWCNEMIHKAKQYDMDTENRYDLVRKNAFYNDIRRHLVKYRYSIEEIQEKLQKSPDNTQLMREYLYVIDTQKDTWGDKRQDELKQILFYCRTIINENSGKNEGVLWRWFNAAINYNDFNITEALAFLGTMDNAENSLTIQFMLYVIKLGQYFKSRDDRLLLEILEHIKSCKRLNQNSNKSSTRYYYSGQKGIGFCYSFDKGKVFKGTVTKWDSPQNGRLSINIQPRLSVFFVPSVISMPEEGAVGSELEFKLGVSFDGLRAWTKNL